MNSRFLRLTVIVSLMVAALIHFPELVSLFDINEGHELFPGMKPDEVISEVVFTFVSLLVLFGMNALLFHFNQALIKIPMWKLVLSAVLTYTLSHYLGEGFVWVHQKCGIPAIGSMVHHYLHPLRDIIITLTVCGTCYIAYLFRRQQQVMVENEQLQAENILNQYEVLKNQLNPHMLFNSLNTLQYLTEKDTDKAQKYIQQLSSVLRYTLRSNEAKSVTLAEEMKFVKSYMYLLEMRYGNNLQFNISIPTEAEKLLLPPMAVQMLIENAVKHNEISNRRPLTITLQTEGSEMIVSNPIQPKMTAETGTGVGLANLAKRYRLLYRRDILITENENFTARLPLISETYENTDN